MVEKRLGTLPKDYLIRRERLRLARQFFIEIVVPLVKEGERPDFREIDEKMVAFQQEHPGDGSDFESPHVFMEASKLLRRTRLAVAQKTEIREQFDLLERAVDVLYETEEARIKAFLEETNSTP